MQPSSPCSHCISISSHKIFHSKDADFTAGICLVSVGLELASVIGLVSDDIITVSFLSQSGHVHPFLILIPKC